MVHSSVSIPDHKRRRGDQDDGREKSCSGQDWGWVIPWVLCRPTSPGLHVFN